MRIVAALCITSFTTVSTLAEKFEPAPVFDYFVPQFESIVRYDDNVYTSDVKSESSFITYLMPSIKVRNNGVVNRYGGEYKLISSFYSDGVDDSDDVSDHLFSLFSYNEYTSRHRTAVDLSYDKLHENRGSGLTEDLNFSLVKSPIQYDDFDGRLYYQFGGLRAKMRIGAGISYHDKQYNNYKDITKHKDLDKTTFLADVDYQAGDITFLTFDLSSADISYKYTSPGSESKNNKDNRFLVGVSWRGVSKIHGSAKFGYQHKKYDEYKQGRDDFNGFTTSVTINWKPIQRSTLSLVTSRSAEESATVGDYINNVSGTLGWEHEWSYKIDTSLQFSYQDKDYVGAERRDKISDFNTEVVYGLSRRLNLALGYNYTNSDSNVDNVSYDRNVFNFSFKVSL
ncbi:outer membrane beta-barrel protein [Psychromonas sp.]|uniref:outer membrane beta-barrel protein n=1 Tax=Psychromonas sp. TaxID=1884585 RepID=UPI003567EC46